MLFVVAVAAAVVCIIFHLLISAIINICMARNIYEGNLQNDGHVYGMRNSARTLFVSFFARQYFTTGVFVVFSSSAHSPTTVRAHSFVFTGI